MKAVTLLFLLTATVLSRKSPSKSLNLKSHSKHSQRALTDRPDAAMQREYLHQIKDTYNTIRRRSAFKSKKGATKRSQLKSKSDVSVGKTRRSARKLQEPAVQNPNLMDFSNMMGEGIDQEMDMKPGMGDKPEMNLKDAEMLDELKNSAFKAFKNMKDVNMRESMGEDQESKLDNIDLGEVQKSLEGQQNEMGEMPEGAKKDNDLTKSMTDAEEKSYLKDSISKSMNMIEKKLAMNGMMGGNPMFDQMMGPEGPNPENQNQSQQSFENMKHMQNMETLNNLQDSKMPMTKNFSNDDISMMNQVQLTSPQAPNLQSTSNAAPETNPAKYDPDAGLSPSESKILHTPTKKLGRKLENEEGLEDVENRLYSIEDKIDHLLLHAGHNLAPTKMVWSAWGPHYLPTHPNAGSLNSKLTMMDGMHGGMGMGMGMGMGDAMENGMGMGMGMGTENYSVVL